MVLFVVGLVSAIPSPHAFYGEVYYSDGVLIGEGLDITASINGNNKTDTLVNGAYDLVVESESGGIVYFYIEGLTGMIGSYTFDSFAVTEFDFTTALSNPNTSGEEEDDTDESSGGTSSSGGGSSSSDDVDYEEYGGEIFEGNNFVPDLETQEISAGITGGTIGISDFNKVLGAGGVVLILVLLIMILIIKSRKH